MYVHIHTYKYIACTHTYICIYGFHNCKRINMYYFKQPILWLFVTAALHWEEILGAISLSLCTTPLQLTSSSVVWTSTVCENCPDVGHINIHTTWVLVLSVQSRWLCQGRHQFCLGWWNWGRGIQEELPQEEVILPGKIPAFLLYLPPPTGSTQIFFLTHGPILLNFPPGHLEFDTSFPPRLPMHDLAPWEPCSCWSSLLLSVWPAPEPFQSCFCPNSGDTFTVLIWVLARDFDFGFS